MTKQEEIREGIAKLTEDRFRFPAENAGLDWDSNFNSMLAKDILFYLDSQGVVIKVERELPKLEHPSYFKEGIEDDADLRKFAQVIELQTKTEVLKAGYVAVELLIGE